MRLFLLSAFLTTCSWGQNYAHSQLDVSLPNDATTGTVLYQLVRGVTGTSPLQVIRTATSDTEALGICSDNCGTTGQAIILLSGAVKCDFDGATTARDYVTVSTTAAGKCHDASSVRPTSARIVGRVLVTIGTAGLAWIISYGTGVDGSFSSASDVISAFTSCSGTQYLGADGACHSAAGGIPSGTITMILSGACPAGFTENSALNGRMLQGTLAANGNVGTTGGSATITPAGTLSAVSAGTPAGTNGAISLGTFVNTATATSGNCAATNLAIGTGATTACKATAPNLTVPAEGHSGALIPPVFTGSVLSTHTHTFTGQAIDPAPSFTRVIFCSAN